MNLTEQAICRIFSNLSIVVENFVSSKISSEEDDYEKESCFIDRLVKEFLIQTENDNHLAAMFFRLNRFDRADFMQFWPRPARVSADSLARF